MVLAIDVGNTNIAVGCIDGGDISRVFRLSTNTAKTAHECAADLRSMLEFHDRATYETASPASNAVGQGSQTLQPVPPSTNPYSLIPNPSIDGAVISCVVPPLTRVFKDAVKLLAGVNAIVVGAGVKTGINILIDDPAQLGGDMVATAVGALASYTPPIIIVDMGTATKMCAIDKNGSFLGGAIVPGLALSMDALAAGTSQLPRVPLEAPSKCISANTIDCMKSGAIYGSAAMIDGMTERFETELGDRAQVVITGGFADLVYRHCKHDIIHDPHLILRGLGIIYEKNAKAVKP